MRLAEGQGRIRHPTSDRYHRGQRGVRVNAESEQGALEQIQKGTDGSGYAPCPDAKIVRCTLSTVQDKH